MREIGFDHAEVRKRLGNSRGKEFWRSLDELADTPEFRAFLEAEFPAAAEPSALGRREFLKVMAASLALGGLSACTRQPTERIVPYVRQPELIVTGKALYFATSIPVAGFGRPILVRSHMGRPVKIEGNPEHPESQGATDPFTQASLLELYDPDRSQVISYRGTIRTWDDFQGAARLELERQRLTRGAGLRLLSGTVTSLSLAEGIGRFLEEFPEARWHQYEPAGRDELRQGTAWAFGQVLEPRYDLRNAEILVALDSDFLCSGPACVRLAREFAAGRRVTGGRRSMSRLYAIEPSPSATGSMADHRLPANSRDLEAIIRKLASGLGIASGGEWPLSNHHQDRVRILLQDLEAHRGRSLLVAGDHLPAHLQSLVHAINGTLGNFGRTVVFSEPVEAHPIYHRASLAELVRDLEDDRVNLLVILGGNPVFDAPADLEFAQFVTRPRMTVHLSMYHNETSELCHWNLPEAHPLESWGDLRTQDGTVGLMQPLIEPLYGGRSALEIVAALSGRFGLSGFDLVREYWQDRFGAEEFEKSWRTALHDGFIKDTALPAVDAAVSPQLGDLLKEALSRPSPTYEDGELEVHFRPDPTIFDGRFANNGWLQELPKPITKLTWDNPVLIGPQTASRLNLRNGDLVELELHRRSVTIPVWILPGQAADCLTLNFGYGRRHAGQVGNGAGFDVFPLRTREYFWTGHPAVMRRIGSRYPLSTTQHHFAMEGRNLIRTATLDEYIRHPHFAHQGVHDPGPEESLFPEAHTYEGYSWGMTIDLNTCTGCSACIIACQAENNIPVVGKKEVGMGREMHWIRVDRYFGGDPTNPTIYHQPVPCMHCENAPCEVVCPVSATLHDSEGLNVMVYNRCVGTRYCSNNCPYKVRRFNWYLYQDWNTPSLKLLRNPDVTVRSRGIMEKCTYCLQRITAARIEAEKEDRKIRDGEVLTACQQVCPTQAIEFGNLNDPGSRVSGLKGEALNYAILADLGVRPRTTYLARLRNPRPELDEELGHE